MSGQLAITVLICLYVIPYLSIRQRDSMEIMMLTKHYESKCMRVVLAQCKQIRRKRFTIGTIRRPDVASVCETERSCFERLPRSGGEPTSGVE